MISKVDISGSNYHIEDNFKKYATKKISKLDRYLPRGHKKDVVAKVVVTQATRDHGDKFEISAAMEIPGGKVISAKDACSNLYAGIDIIEAKLTGQIRRFKLEQTPHLKKEKRGLKGLFGRR
ncbi:ribosome-associated translation inhibitor RaiA [Candidatus Saccharibacteria bacterium]|nr:ribosome-associated translation inhibitor RaiA [Candidatus Saccharibacteria bacterium]